MPFAATWIDLETLILSEVSQKKKKTKMSYNSTYLLALKYGRDDPI